MKWFNKIRHSDEKTKRFWVAVLSGGSMTVVIIFWLWYMSYFISDVGTQEIVFATDIKFWPVFKTGAATILNSLKEKIVLFVSKLYSVISNINIGSERVINIQNQ